MRYTRQTPADIAKKTERSQAAQPAKLLRTAAGRKRDGCRERKGEEENENL